MENIKKIKWNLIGQAAIMIVIGFVLIFWPGASLVVMARALAILLIVAGITSVVGFLARKAKSSLMSGVFAVGVILIVIGAWIFANPFYFIALIPKLFGVFILLSGLTNLGQTFTLMRNKYRYWWISLIFAVITLFMGGFLLFNPAEASAIAVTMIGAFIVYDGISNLWTISRLTKVAKNISAEMNAVDVEATIEDK